MTPAQSEAAEVMYTALGNLPCRCVYSEPYCDRDPKKLEHECARCKGRRLWEAAKPT